MKIFIRFRFIQEKSFALTKLVRCAAGFAGGFQEDPLMFTVKTPEEVFSIISSEFHRLPEAERCPLARCCGRILAENITACENVPGFNRSTVDGYAVRAADTFGCSDSIPAILPENSASRSY